MKTSFIALIALLISNTTDVQLSPARASSLFKSFDFVMVSSKPGAAIAFRLKKNHSSDTASICFRQECLAASYNWSLLATDPSLSQKQYLVLEDSEHRYTFRRIALESELVTPVSPLRLPTNVVETLEEESPQIITDKSHDQLMFQQSAQLPWSNQWHLPVRSIVTSDFGSWRRPPNGEPYGHTGADLRAAKGTKVEATSDGVVVQTEKHVIEGRVITIDHGGGLMSRYAHLSAFKVKIGDRVKAGDVIGLSGSTGRSEAPHLHFEMRIRGRPVDPLSTQRLMARLSYLE